MTIAARFVLKALERLSVGRLTLHLPDGTTHRFGNEGATPHAELHVRDWLFFRRVVLDGDIGFAEAYMEGFCDSPDLPGLIALLAENEKSLGRMAHTNVLHDLALKFLHWQRRNSRKGSRKNIHAHYDLGNEFYRLWLDPTMTYSSALYEGTDGQPLEAAQTAKYERILEQIGAKQGDSILEIGCGWGGFAETAARRGMRVTGVTISQQQLEYARARLERAGLGDRVDFQFRDYRDMEGFCDSPDLPGLIALLAENEKSLGRMAHTNVLHDLALKFLHWQRRNSRKGSRKNIHAHYDLGNEFYRLWLDPTMTYSSALYEGTDGQPLEAAQTAKYERILEQIGAKQGDSILEIGCGWGGFAETAARRGMRVTGVTISQQQLDYARARLERAGLGDRVDFQFRDYRDMEGSYDHIVSIEMIEAVGERYWPDYFAALKRHVVPGGSILVQAIVIADDFFESYRRHPDFIQTYVFPGGMLLSPTSLREQCRQAGLKVAELYSFGRDYARTLETWLGRFDRVADQVAKMGFDERFRRMWRYYLAYCAAGFSTGRTDVLQAHFRHI